MIVPETAIHQIEIKMFVINNEPLSINGSLNYFIIINQFLMNELTSALVFCVVLCVLCLSFVSFCWLWYCLSSNLTISVCPYGIFEFLCHCVSKW